MYRIGQLANLTKVSKRTIDYYTNLVSRSDSNYRYYDEIARKSFSLLIHLPILDVKLLLEQKTKSRIWRQLDRGR